MKTCVIFPLLMLGTALCAQADSSQADSSAAVAGTASENQNNITMSAQPAVDKPDRNLVIITGARFVSMAAFWGSPEVGDQPEVSELSPENDLPPPRVASNFSPVLASSTAKP